MRTRRNHAFTLVELLVVIAIIGILVGLLLPAVQAVRESGRRTQCKNNLKQLGLAVKLFEETYKKLPPARYRDGFPTWYVLILPYMEATPEYELWDLGKSYYEDTNAIARQSSIKGFTCPSRRESTNSFSGDMSKSGGIHLPGAVGDYAGNAGNNKNRESFGAEGSGPPYWQTLANGILITTSSFVGEPRIADGKITWDSDLKSAHVKDGLSKTIMIGEKHVRFGFLGRGPGDGSIYNGTFMNNFARAGGIELPLAEDGDDTTGCDSSGCHNFGSWHPGVCLFVMADGSVIELRADIDARILHGLTSRNGGEAVKIE